MSAYEHGDPNSAICLVGEAPGLQEMKRGEPFVGEAGQVLDRCLVAAGIDRSRCYIVNTFEGQVRKDTDGSAWGVGGKLFVQGKGLTPAGVEQSQGALKRIRECGARMVVPLGGIALSLVAPETRGQIGKWRGSTLEVQGKKAVATYHPATVIYGSTHLQHVIATDLGKAKDESRFPEVRRRARDLQLDPSFAQSITALQALRFARERTFFDLELFGGQLSAISLTNVPDWSISIPFITAERTHRWSEREEAQIIGAIADLVADPEVPKGNQNVTFDLHILAKLYGMLPQGRLDDPMVLHSLAHPDLEKSLAFQTSVYTDVPYYKDDGGKRAWEDPFRNIQAFWRYSALDACVALECWEALEREHRGGPVWRTYEETMELVEPIIFMMLRGQKLDTKGMKARRAELASELAGLEEQLRTEHEDIGPRKLPKGKPIGFNPASPKQCIELFYGKLGFPPYMTKGKVSTDVYALRRLSRKGCREARDVLRVRALHKQIEFLDVPSSDGRLYTAYNIRGAKTGRLSAEENELGEGRNSQNLTSMVKAFLVSDDVVDNS